MKGKKHKPEQIIRKLREAEAMLSADKTIGQVCQALEISEQTYPPLAEPVRRHEGRGSQAAEGVGGREQAAEEAAGRGRTGQGDSEGSLGGKLLSPTRRRTAVRHVRDRCRVSERRACKALSVPRSTQRYCARPDTAQEQRLVACMHELVREYPRYGYRFIWAKLRQRRMAREREEGLSPVASRGLQGAEKGPQKAAFGPQRQQLRATPRGASRITFGRGTSSTTGRRRGSR